MRLEEPMHLDVFDFEKPGRAAAGRPLSRVLASVLTATLLGCAGAPSGIQQTHAPSEHGYALLYEILGQERQVSRLLFIKLERAELETVIDAIAETCSQAYERLGVLANANPRLDLTDTGLPIEEVRTRESIAATRRTQLLAASGRELELELLLSQNEALTYIGHLADTLSRHEEDPERLAFARKLWKDVTRLQEDVLALLRRPVTT
ncbi:MAG TPA: hypothetical protein VGB13_10655 [Candidatus Krumholzibacteria bacterium]